MHTNVLSQVYPPEEIFVQKYEFDDQAIAIDVICQLPPGRFYTATPILHVTAENYVRCLSQASYLLAEHILEEKLVPVEMPVEAFRRVAANHEILYRHLAMNFHSLVNRADAFPMRLALKNWKELRRLQDFLLFTFTNQRTVISGEMSFVFVS